MTVKARTDRNSYEAYFTHEGKRFRKSFKTELEAKQWEANALSCVAQNIPITDVKQSKNIWTLKDATIATRNAVWRDTKAESTAIRNSNAVLDFFGSDISVSVINTQKIQGFIDYLRETKKNSNATINRKTAALSKILRYAYQNDRIEKMPYIPRQREPLNQTRYLSEEEEIAILKVSKQLSWDHLADLVTFLINTGARIGEARKLVRSAVSDEQVMFYDTKNGTHHTVPLNTKAQGALTRQLARHSEPKVFPYSYTHIEDRFQKVLEVTGIADGVHLHTLRHTFGSRLVQRGVPIQTVSKLMNHSSIQVTMRYAHLAPSNLQNAVELI